MTIDPHLGIVGRAGPRIDSLAQATGAVRYVDDISYPGMLHGKILRSTKAHARIIAVDASAAEALPGVLAVLTGADLPVAFGLSAAVLVLNVGTVIQTATKLRTPSGSTP